MIAPHRASEIAAPPHLGQVVRDGVKATFGNGAVYRHPGLPPLLEIAGSHYEMGLQYGVLLRPEILGMLAFFETILRVMAQEAGVTPEAFLSQLRVQTEALASRLPQRFVDEMRGLAEGSGVPVDTVRTVALAVDVMAAKSCASVLMRGAEGAVLHGHNADMFGFSGEHTAVVRRRATGYHAVTQYDYPLLFLGTYKAENDQGLTHTEETLPVRQPGVDGVSLYYLVRMALEECASLDEVGHLLGRQRLNGGSGSVWSSRRERRGMVLELTPQGWARREFADGLLWNFNRVYDSDLQRFQHPRANLGRSDHDRDHAAAAFPVRDAYTVDDVITFLRLQRGPADGDYAWCGTRWPICNMAGQQMLVFDPDGDGVYMAWGRGFAARQAIYRIHADFAFAPQLYLLAAPLSPLAEALAAVENQIATRHTRLDAVIGLAEQHPGDAQISFIAARKSFLLKQPEFFVEYAGRAYRLNPAVPEYRLYAGLAAFQRGDFERARLFLEPLSAAQLFPEQALYRLWTLEAIYRDYHPELAAAAHRQKQIILDDHDAHGYFEAAIAPLLSALTPASLSSTSSD